ncbi:MAG: hypothetical protein R6W70_09995 [bacterium]
MRLIFFLSVFLFVLCAFSFQLVAETEVKDSIVVWRIEPKTGVSEKEADTISEMVTAEVGRISGRSIISENEMKTLLTGEEIKFQCGAGDSACVAEIGAALGAPESITGTISKMGQYWILTLQRINVRNVEVVSRYEKKIRGDENLLIESIAPAVRHLFDVAEKSISETAFSQKSEEPEIKEKNTFNMKKPGKLSKVGKIGIGLMSGGAAILIFGGVSHWKTGVEKKAYQDGKTDGDISSYNKWRAVSITSYSAGALTLSAGTAMLVFDIVIDSPVKTSLIPTKNGAYFSVRWRF